MIDFNKKIKKDIFSIINNNFESLALQVFTYQYQHNLVYQKWINLLNINVKEIDSINKIPFMPIDFFKRHQIISKQFESYTIFESSGTTGSVNSKHFVGDVPFYLQNAEYIFENIYKTKLENCCFLALLPSYLERNNSSLVCMVEHFIQKSNNSNSGFYLNNVEELVEKITTIKDKKIFLIGVTFALLDLAEQFPNLDLSHCTIMETGGMKGRRKEMLRDEVHQILTKAFNVNKIHSEYGMTELLSQGYSKGDGIFECPPQMRILLRDINDPLHINNHLRYGGINVIDLANIDTCSFIATQDLGKIVDQEKNSFEVIGRFDNSDLRGCNLMVL